MTSSQHSTGNHARVGWVILILLLLLRIPYTVIATYLWSRTTGWPPAVYQLGTYLLTAFFIWWERDDLSDVHLDGLSIVLIVLFGPAQTLILRYWGIQTPLTFPHPAGLLIWAAAIVLTIALGRSTFRRAVVNRTTVGWLAAGLLAGLLLASLQNLDSFRNAQNLVPLPSVSGSTGLAFFYQLGYAAACEEPLFRGFLWGYLRRLGWPDGRAWLLQAGLFMIAHLYFINALRLQFWLLIPASGLLFGLFAWRSRSIAPGMLAHAAVNSGAYILLLNALAAVLRWS